MRSLEEQIEVMSAFASGKQVEATSLVGTDVWRIEESPSWNWSKKDYRIKKQPVKVEIMYKGGELVVGNNLYSVLRNLQIDGKGLMLTISESEEIDIDYSKSY